MTSEEARRAAELRVTVPDARDRFMREVWGEEWTRDRSGEPPAFREILNSLMDFERVVEAEVKAGYADLMSAARDEADWHDEVEFHRTKGAFGMCRCAFCTVVRAVLAALDTAHAPQEARK